MKKDKFSFLSLLTLIFSFTFIQSCYQDKNYDLILGKYENVGLNCLSLVEIEEINILSGEPFSGNCIVYDSNSGIKVRMDTYLDGILEGISIGFYPSGEKEYIGYRNKGEISGDYIKFYRNGEISVKGKFKNGFYNGTFEYYDDKGKIVEKKRFTNDGILIKSKTYE